MKKIKNILNFDYIDYKVILLIFFFFTLFSCSKKVEELSSEFLNDYVDFLLIEQLYKQDSTLAYHKLSQKLKDTSFSLNDFKKRLSLRRYPMDILNLQEQLLKKINLRVQKITQTRKE